MQRIKYPNNKATVTIGKFTQVSVRLSDNKAVVTRGGTSIKLVATSPHKVKIAVKRVLAGMGAKFKPEYRLR